MAATNPLRLLRDQTAQANGGKPVPVRTLAKDAHVAPNTVNRIEQGLHIPTLIVARKLVTALAQYDVQAEAYPLIVALEGWQAGERGGDND